MYLSNLDCQLQIAQKSKLQPPLQFNPFPAPTFARRGREKSRLPELQLPNTFLACHVNMFEGFKLQLCLAAIIALLLVAIASVIVKVHSIVRFGSGLGSTEILRGMWSKSDQVLFQPVPSVWLLAAPAGVGLAYALKDFITTLFQLADFLHERHSPARDIITLVSFAAGGIFSTAVYGLGGGKKPYVNVFVTVLLSVIAGSLDVVVFLVHHDQPHQMQPILMLVLISVVVGAAGFWGSRHFHSKDTIIISRKGAQPYKVFAWGFAVLLACRLANWATLFFAGGPGDHTDLELHYLARVAVRISDILLLMACALVSIATANQLIMAGNYRWQWPSFVVPFALLVPVEIIGSCIIFGRNHHYRVFAQMIHNLLKFGATGLIGAVAYLFVVARYARAALDPGADGQSELLEIDDDDDDDYERSDFEV